MDTPTISSTTGAPSRPPSSTEVTSTTPPTTSGQTSSTFSTNGPPSTEVTSTTAPQTTTSAGVPPVICENGGTYDGIKCICTASFYGPACQYSANTIDTNLPYPGTLVADTELVVTVTNFNYTEELKDAQSETYRSFERHFETEIRKIYGNIPGYEGVKIIGLKPGSIVVEHKVFFTVMGTRNVTERFEKVMDHLVGRLQDTAASQGACQHNKSILCLNVLPNPIVKNMTEAPSLDEICWQRAPRDYRDFYFAVTTGDTIHCITNCTPNAPTTMDCHHGQCRVTRAGPQCFCDDEALYWYTGSRCSGRVSKLATGLGLVATVLLITCIVLTVLLFRDHQRKYVLSTPQTSSVGKWYEDDGFTWHANDGFIYRNMGADGATGDPRPPPPS
ncbi:mucin-17-like [Phalacrocorax aristotelis]|uniref:mucin-17-like n=1 Tax=Phalacrocorax aristotelis TaxID=126867 RepID=UPI003F4BA66D